MQARPFEILLDHILLDNEPRLMHKGASIRWVFKSPVRITVPVVRLDCCGEETVMPAIRDASAGGPMPGETRLRNDGILPVQLKREEIPVNFLFFTGSLDSALPSVVIASERGDLLLRVRLDSTIGCRRSIGQPFLPFCPNEPNGKTLVKTMFEYERSQPGECLAGRSPTARDTGKHFGRTNPSHDISPYPSTSSSEERACARLEASSSEERRLRWRGALMYVMTGVKLTNMEKTQIYFRREELDALRKAAARSGRSVAELVRDAVRQVVLKPNAAGPVALWDGKPKRTSIEHDSVHDEP